METNNTPRGEAAAASESRQDASQQPRPLVTDAPLPQPAGMLGTTIGYLRDPFGFITRSARQGRVVRLPFPKYPIYQLTVPADIEQVLVHANQQFRKGALIQEVVGAINDEGLLSSRA